MEIQTSPKPERMEVITSNIPQELTAKDQWVIWKYEFRNGKWTKPPRQVNGRAADSTDPKTWTSYDRVIDALNNGAGWDGIGFALNREYTGFDFDDCRDPATGQIFEPALSEIADLNSYTEISPSGCGLKVLVRGKLPKGGHHKNGCGVFDNDRYFTVTGNCINGVSKNIEERQVQVDAFMRKRWPKDFEQGDSKEPSCEINSSSQEWERAKAEISKYNRIMFHFLTPKPDDRSGHDWRLACLCIEAGITNERLLYQIILNNPHGKAQHYPKTNQYIQEIISKALSQTPPLEEEKETPVNIEIPFPKEAIGGVAGEFADLYSQYLESPWSFFAFSFLTFLGLLVSDRIKLFTQTKPQPRLYSILIGQTGRARKSEAISQTQDFFDCGLFNSIFKICGGIGSAEGLIHWVTNNFSAWNATARIIKKGLIIYDEFESFVQKLKIESSTLSTAVRTLFRLNRYENQVKGTKDVQIEDLFLAILGACTQEVFQTMWESDHISGGTLNRFWLIRESTNRAIPIARPIPPEKIGSLREKVNRMLMGLPENRFFDIDQDAEEFYSSWYIEQAKDTSDFAVRLEEYAERLALLLAFNRDQDRVDLQTIQDTITLIKWQRQVREECFPQIAVGVKARVEARIRNQVLKNAHTGITRGQVDHRIHASDFDTWIIENSYKGLEKAGHILLRNGRYFPGPNMPNSR